MRLLMCLAEHAGEVVSIDELLDQAWSGVTVAPDSVYQAVASLRRLLGDDPKQPTYIATVPRLGYQMVADVSPWIDQPVADTPSSDARRRTAVLTGVGIALAVAFVASVWFFGRAAIRAAAAQSATAQLERSIAVLPFLDLTDEMNHELFVDGMTEELVDKLSKIPRSSNTARAVLARLQRQESRDRRRRQSAGDRIRARRQRPSVGRHAARQRTAGSGRQRLRRLVRDLQSSVRRSRDDRGRNRSRGREVAASLRRRPPPHPFVARDARDLFHDPIYFNGSCGFFFIAATRSLEPDPQRETV